jgi:hypothetical protein
VAVCVDQFVNTCHPRIYGSLSLSHE